MIHPGLTALEKWQPVEYASGYRARLAGIPDSEEAHHCWRCGWEDADTEALESDRNKRVLAEGGEDDYANTWGLLFDTGGDAREWYSVRWRPNTALERGMDRSRYQYRNGWP
jgi:hypothetical protein